MEGKEFDSLVKDMSLAAWGRKEIELAQVEMPGMSSLQLFLFNAIQFGNFMVFQ
jgi:S-adenosylhomocysteine hydrolase